MCVCACTLHTLVLKATLYPVRSRVFTRVIGFDCTVLLLHHVTLRNLSFEEGVDVEFVSFTPTTVESFTLVDFLRLVYLDLSLY